jgi:radical SAM protein with 4Fe4S-binding SPASM domain
MLELEGVQVPNIDLSKYVDFVGTAHFSRKSAQEVAEKVNRTKPEAVCVELCPYRYYYIRNACRRCPKRSYCSGKCEFIIATEVLGNRNADIWLIDMTEKEIWRRIACKATVNEAEAWRRILGYVGVQEARGFRLWEEGLKDEAIRYFNGNMELMRKAFPTLWHVLISERNALMACRLIYVISRYFEEGMDKFKILAVTGAAHVEGIKELLKNPAIAFTLLEKYGITFTPPYMIRRVKVD